MKTLTTYVLQILLAAWLLGGLVPTAGAQPPRPDPHRAPDSPVMLYLATGGTDPDKIDYDKLPRVKGMKVVICPKDPEWKFQLHNYLVRHEGLFWCMWSHGPAEDDPTQHIRYATSKDGLTWGASKVLAGPPKEGYAYIARGFWPRDGELLAMLAHFKGKGAFGVNKELKLEAYVQGDKDGPWKYKGLIHDNAINSYPPQKLPSGEWMMTRRQARFTTSMIIGGVKALDDWRDVLILDYIKSLKEPAEKRFFPDEPIWYPLPDGNLVALFRDNGGSSRLFRSFSTDMGRSWSKPVPTNFPNATSKAFTLLTSTGYRVLVNNANPKMGRRQLMVSLSRDGLVYNRMLVLDIPSDRASTFQYPHVLEHDGFLWIAYSKDKATIEMLRVALGDLEPAPAQGPKD
jgi:hypothetical protein